MSCLVKKKYLFLFEKSSSDIQVMRQKPESSLLNIYKPLINLKPFLIVLPGDKSQNASMSIVNLFFSIRPNVSCTRERTTNLCQDC